MGGLSLIEFEFSWFGVSGTLAALLGFAAAAFVLKYMPDRRAAWLLGALIVVESILIATAYSGFMAWLPDRESWLNIALMRFHFVNDFVVAGIYLPALARLIDSPMLRVFRTSTGTLLSFLIGATGTIAIAFGPVEWHAAGFKDAIIGYPGYLVEVGVVSQLGFLLLAACYVYGLVATILAWRQSTTELQKRKNGVLVLAFGARDLTFGLLFGLATYTNIQAAALGIDNVLKIAFFSAYYLTQVAAIGLIVYVIALAYGALATHLFDIDIKLKVTLERGTVMAIYVVFFFIVSEGTASFLSDQFGVLVGLITTGVLLLFLTPIQRWAERLSDAAMPTVQQSPEYLQYRKLQVYGEAVSDTVRRKGFISAVDRAVLNQLQANLGLTQNDISSLEHELLTQNGALAGAR